LLDAGEVGRAEAAFRAMPPENGDVQAALGLIAHYAGRQDEARERWRRAVALGVEDDALCFRYAMLAENAGAPAGEIRAVLARAVAIRPEFDDARFRLALLEKNAEHFEEAIAQLRAMRQIAPERAYAYWSALSDALNATGQFRDAEEAANTALRQASTAEERRQAAQQAYIARTEMVVQMQPDAAGKARMVAVRLARGPAGGNRFVETGDDVRRGTGVLAEIVCGEGPTRFVVEIDGARVALAIPDPARVQMIRAPEEFTCGKQDRRSVSVVYAAREGGGILRGIEFR
jgi:tetratricopeptide (TPR) repeat protein